MACAVLVVAWVWSLYRCMGYTGGILEALVILAVLTTAYLFRRDLRHPPGCCQRCGYDLQGNVSGVCPKCDPATGERFGSHLGSAFRWAGLVVVAMGLAYLYVVALGAFILLAFGRPGFGRPGFYLDLLLLGGILIAVSAVGIWQYRKRRHRLVFWRLIVPEWDMLNEHEKERAYKAAAYALGWRRWIPFLVAPLLSAPLWLTLPSMVITLRGILVIIFTGILILPLLFLGIRRAPLRRASWAMLAARGEPICTACGYNLTGNVSGKCSECGSPTSTTT